MSARARYHFVASVLFIAIGVVILVRAVLAHVPFAGLLGVVFLALGIVRIRAFLNWKRQQSDS
ncbi:MAG TPA: DUF308 domain-containing protein [Chloroflexota bacterium]|nr:DUF308 domain-containing protein [Chloroflexota bacterium]